MCKWCEAKSGIEEIMKIKGLRSRDLKLELDSWDCEDEGIEEDSNEDLDEDSNEVEIIQEEKLCDTCKEIIDDVQNNEQIPTGLLCNECQSLVEKGK